MKPFIWPIAVAVAIGLLGGAGLIARASQPSANVERFAFTPAGALTPAAFPMQPPDSIPNLNDMRLQAIDQDLKVLIQLQRNAAKR